MRYCFLVRRQAGKVLKRITQKGGSKMRITESNVTMAAARTFNQSGTKAKGETNRSSFEDTKSAISYDTGRSGAYERNNYGSMTGYGLYNHDFHKM